MTDDEHLDEQLVLPGQELGVIEEFLPADNCYEDEENGTVVAAALGHLKVEKHQASVAPKRKIFVPKRGSIALGMVAEIRKQTASIEIAHFKVGNVFKDMRTRYVATLHITNISDRYVRSMHDAVRPADWVLCKIIKYNPADGRMDVSLFGSRQLGVIYAACFQCNAEISKVVKRSLVRCSACGTTQSRTLSTDFGELNRYFPPK